MTKRLLTVRAWRTSGPWACALLVAGTCWLALHGGRGRPSFPAVGRQVGSTRPCDCPPSTMASDAGGGTTSVQHGVHLISSVYSIELANLYAAAGEHAHWARFLGHYLDPANATGFHLSDGSGPLLGRLATRSFPAVEGGPVVSVIMVASNAQATLPYAARSILAQTWRALELIIVDDASTDDTWALAEALRASDPRVRLLRNPVSVGPYVSRNRALSTVVSGAYVTTHDADDWAQPRRLEVQVRNMVDSAGGVRGNYMYGLRVRASGVVTVVPVGPASPDGVSRQACPTAMYEVTLLRDHLGFWDCVQYEADNEMMFRARALLGEAGFVEIATVGILLADRPGSLGKQGHRPRAPSAAPAVDVDAAGGAHGTDAAAAAADEPPPSARDVYRQAYSKWHEASADDPSGRGLYLDFPQAAGRTIAAPDEMVVGLDKVCACLKGTARECAG